MRRSWTLAVASLVAATVVASGDGTAAERHLVGRWVGSNVNDPQQREVVLVLVDGGPGQQGRTVTGTVTFAGEAPVSCSFSEDRYGNWIGGWGRQGVMGGMGRDPDRLSLSTDLGQYSFRRVSGRPSGPVTPPKAPPRPTVEWGEVREIEVVVSWVQGVDSSPAARHHNVYLDRTSRDGRRMERHYVRSSWTSGRNEKNHSDLEGVTIGFDQVGSPPRWRALWSDGSPMGPLGSGVNVTYSLVPEDPSVWDAASGSRSGTLQSLDPAQAPESCPQVVRLLMDMVRRNGDFGRQLEAPRWSVEATGAPSRLSCELFVRRERCIDRVTVTQAVRAATRPFPGSSAQETEGAPSAVGGASAPRAPAPLPAPLVAATIADGLARAREAGKLLAVVFTSGEPELLDADPARVAHALRGRDVAPLRDKFLFVHRLLGDDLGLPTPEAEAYVADESPTVLLLDPWADAPAAGRPHPTLARVTDLRQLRGGLERAMLEAARSGHPPTRR